MTSTETNPLVKANQLGQSLWLDFIQRSMLESGELARLIRDDRIAGLTSNPSIFEQAIAKSSEYDQSILAITQQAADVSDLEVFNQIAIQDIQQAADIFAEVYRDSDGQDGRVSLEVSPRLAHDTEATVASALELNSRIQRDNIMIKVPGTQAGVAAFERLTAEGVSVNVTLLFSVARYREIAQAYIRGLQTRAEMNLPLDTIASVASFFVSRVDTEVDKALAASSDPAAAALSGSIAIANAKVAYGHFAKLFGSDEFAALADKGAKPQRLLWASTGTKNPAYSDVLYVEELLGPSTVNTLPPATMDAFRDHGTAEQRLTGGLDQAHKALTTLAEIGISLGEITNALESAGIKSFDDAFNRLLHSIKDKRGSLATG